MATVFRDYAKAVEEQRFAPRHRVSVERASVRGHGQDPIEARLHDLSLMGCRITHDGNRAPGERVWLRFDGGRPIAATVIWNDAHGATGCQFDQPISGALLRMLTSPL